ncbi:hypothetical protein MHU86_766 [Fragilaria crotonensis]|nr:hypothetical protein MHU86_766 [Fragilaria crotonensis]
MNCQGGWAGRCPSGGEAWAMTNIQPTDIMLGRGPTCYNNAGNIMFRNLIKENVIYYRNQTRRSEKAALVKLVVSKLKAKGCRFLYRASPGVWVEASTQIAEKKVGHGLRDARLDAATSLPRNFRPAIAEQKHTDAHHVRPVLTAAAKNSEDIHCKTLDNTALNATSADPQRDGHPTKVQKSLNHLIREWEQHLLNEDVPFFPNESIEVASELQEYLVLMEEGRRKNCPSLNLKLKGTSSIWMVAAISTRVRSRIMRDSRPPSTVKLKQGQILWNKVREILLILQQSRMLHRALQQHVTFTVLWMLWTWL